MRVSKKINFGIFLLIGILLISFVSADYIRSSVQSFQFGSQTTFDEFDNSVCNTGQDFLIQIAPAGCTPAVVRSDLLEEQNVPVYCQLGATKINPLIDVDAINTVSFSGEYPDEISGIGFHPARAALNTEQDISSPVLNNIGYVTIVLKQQQNASSLPDFVEGTLTAKINYDIKKAFGIGDVSFYLPELGDDEWQNKYNQYGIWNGKGFLRAEGIGEDGATVSIYDSSFRKVTSAFLSKGEESNQISLPGFDCLAGLKLKLDDVKNPDTRVKLRIDGDIVEVSKGERFLESRCSVNSLEDNGLNQKVSINCKEDDGVVPLDFEIKPKLRVSVDGVEGDYEVGDWLYDTEDLKSVYLGLVGTYDNTGKTSDLYVYFAELKKKDKLSDDDISDVAKLDSFFKPVRATGVGVVDLLATIGKASAGSAVLVQKAITKGMNVQYLSYAYLSGSNVEVSPAQNVFGHQVKIVGFSVPQNNELNSETENYFRNAINDYDTILDSFSSEKYYDDVTYGKEALIKKIILAVDLEQKETAVELCEEFRDKYSTYTNEIKSYCDNKYILSSSETASRNVFINGLSRRITFEGIYKPSLNEFSAEVFVKGINEDYTRVVTLQKDERVYVSENEFISLKELKDGSAVFDVRSVDETVGKQLTYSPNSLEIELNDYQVIGKNDYQVRVDGINLKKTAKVSVIPNVPSSGTEANFNFKIGIEKRAIQLSPEKTRETIRDLNETIEKWTKISNTLGQTVKTLKTACLGTGVALTAKNLLVNAGGGAIARQNVMRGEGGWYEQCTDLVAVGSYSSIDQCMLDNADDIDKDVETWSSVIEEQNNQIKNLQSGITEKKFLSEDVVNTDKFMQEYAPDTKEYLESNLGDVINDPDGISGSINTGDVTNIFSYNAWKDNKYSLEQLRDIELYTKVLESDPNNEIAQKRLYSAFAEVKTVSESYTNQANWADDLGVLSSQIGFLEIGKSSKELSYDGLNNGDLNIRVSGVEDEAPVKVLQASDGRRFILVLDDSSGTDILPIRRTGDNGLMIYDGSGNLLSIENVPIELGNVYFKKYDSNSYKNSFKSSFGENEPIVKYYETEPYKGLPAIVPFDLNDGWYAATKPTLPVLGGIRAYDESGRVSSFWLCNVGQNGIEEFSNVGDDICEQINLGIGQPYNQFSGLSEDEALKKVEAGQKAIEQASRQYSSGVKGVNINVGYGNFNLNVGSPAVDIPDMQCQDFMSPKDCQLLFNVCDPVICPSSRCDLGGAYPVKDVVQSGIVGSLALCLPNIQEGIYIPVCLSGLQTGIDGLLSISNSYRDCLQESLDTGQQVGVCDEIHSIYLCEFMWRQALPLAKIAVPKIVESLLGQNTRGGGEYLGVQSAFDNAEDSATYFTQYYGENSFNAFRARSTENAGGEVCKVFASGVYPNGGNLIDSLTEPDSPPQFHGRFDEIPFTTATVPPTSQYKVFYHIYAGKDTGAYYQVYLKGTPETSFYQDVSSSRIVASGYIPSGGYASETKDFTAASGYQQLCIMVNNQEECGFAQVSTDFAVDYVSDKYAEEQASQTDIKIESECVSGSASAYSLLNPNVQEGIDEVINPEIYNRGITRVCATDNPGRGTDAYAGGENSRWVEVGYCDNENIKCWLDTQSVSDVIKNTDVEENVLETVSENQLDILRNKEGYLSSDDVKALVNDVEDLISNSNFEDAVDKVDRNFGSVFLNSEKANLLLLRGVAYGRLATEEDIIKDRETRTFSQGEITTPEEEIVIGGEETTEKPVTEIDTSGSKVGENIYKTFYELQEDNPVTQYDSTRFVTTSLNEAGISGVQVSDDFDYFVSFLDESNNFVEVDVNKLKRGDIILLGIGCETDFVGIFDSYSLNRDLVERQYYYAPFEFEIVDSPYYIYRAYRYSGDLTVTEKNSIREDREKWTIDSALEETNNRLASVGDNGGKYFDNKKFVDELVFDGLLTEEECNDMRGIKIFAWRVGEKTMSDLKNILLLKNISPGEAESVIQN